MWAGTVVCWCPCGSRQPSKTQAPCLPVTTTTLAQPGLSTVPKSHSYTPMLCLPAQEPWRAPPHPPSVHFHGGTTAKKPDLSPQCGGGAEAPQCHCTLETACLVGSQGLHTALQATPPGGHCCPLLVEASTVPTRSFG